MITEPSEEAAKVTPFAGVWIEICLGSFHDVSVKVTPFAGVWIEIRFSRP